MIYKAYAAYDLKARVYLQPSYFANPEVAMRAFSDGCKKEESPFTLHPEDYQLFEIGSWDDVAGVLSPLTPPRFVCSALDFVPMRPVLPATQYQPDNFVKAMTNGGDH